MLFILPERSLLFTLMDLPVISSGDGKAIPLFEPEIILFVIVTKPVNDPPLSRIPPRSTAFEVLALVIILFEMVTLEAVPAT